MRDQIRSATTVICMATMLHTIATGNMTPSYRVMADGTVRQIYFYCVDISEFAVNKLADRGSLSARGIVTNVQDFICTTAKALGLEKFAAKIRKRRKLDSLPCKGFQLFSFGMFS